MEARMLRGCYSFDDVLSGDGRNREDWMMANTHDGASIQAVSELLDGAGQSGWKPSD
jgi:hypothetical protein